MAIEIACEVSSYKLTKLANDLEKEGFIPISMTGVPVKQDYYKCMLMHKKE